MIAKLTTYAYVWVVTQTARMERNEDTAEHLVCEGPTELEHLTHTVPMLSGIGWWT